MWIWVRTTISLIWHQNITICTLWKLKTSALHTTLVTEWKDKLQYGKKPTCNYFGKFGNFSKTKESIMSVQRFVHAYSYHACDSPYQEMVQMYINRWTKNWIVAYPQNDILLRNKYWMNLWHTQTRTFKIIMWNETSQINNINILCASM